MPSDSRASWFSRALAIISAKDRFFGGPESDGDGRLVTGRDGRGLLPLEETPGRVPLVTTVLGLVADAVVNLTGGRDDPEYVLPEAVVGLSIGREAGFGELMLGRDSPSTVVSVRGAFGSVLRKSSSAFRLGAVVLCRDVGFEVGDGLGFSPVMAPRRSAIPIVARV